MFNARSDCWHLVLINSSCIFSGTAAKCGFNILGASVVQITQNSYLSKSLFLVNTVLKLWLKYVHIYIFITCILYILFKFSASHSGQLLHQIVNIFRLEVPLLEDVLQWVRCSMYPGIWRTIRATFNIFIWVQTCKSLRILRNRTFLFINKSL